MSVPGYFGDEGVCGVGFWEETLFLFLGRWYRGWELLRVIRTLEVWSGSQDTELSILYKQSLQWWFHCIESKCLKKTQSGVSERLPGHHHDVTTAHRCPSGRVSRHISRFTQVQG